MRKTAGLKFECTYDIVTFYRRGNKYYGRMKSSLTREQVLYDPAFKNTMAAARRMAMAGAIGAAIYSQIPILWRQGWMYHSFTGEAMVLLKNGFTDEQVRQLLYQTYVHYWDLYEQATGIAWERGKPIYRKSAQTTPSRKKHRSIDPKRRRYENCIGDNHWKRKSSNKVVIG